MNPIIPDDILQDTVRAEGHDRCVELEYIGEGRSGDFDETDPDDIPLLRFTVLDQVEDTGEWLPVDDASYCTNLPATISLAKAEKAALILLGRVEGVPHLKKLCEKLSWISEKDVDAGGMEQ